MKLFGSKKTVEKRPLGVYVHIPFCVKKCNYCDFLSASSDEKGQEQYTEALIKEIQGYQPFIEEYQVKTVYFGGGTPSVLPVELLERVLKTLDDVFQLGLFEKESKGKKAKKEKKVEETEKPQIELTIEVNPGTVTKDKLTRYKELGFNRLSIGIQSAKDAELQLLGRIHTFAEAKQCYEWAREVGFTNISVDVISALPGQTLSDYKETLQQMIALAPEHISSYSLIVEEGTPFYEQYGEGKEKHEDLPEEELDREMYACTKELLKSAGYERYEISNYSKAGYESKHNTAYWTGTEYLGLGLGASSLFTNARYHNEVDRAEYIRKCMTGEDVRCDIERLVETEQMEEFMILGLRLMRGVSRAEFQKRFGRAVETIYGTALKKLQAQQLITIDGDRIFLTDLGIDVSNQVFVEFVPEEFVRR